MILDLPDDKMQLKLYIANYVEMLDKNTYPDGKREEIRYCLNKAREKLRKAKK